MDEDHPPARQVARVDRGGHPGVVNAWDDEERHRVTARLDQLCGRLPGTQIDKAHGHTGYLVRGKRYAWLLVNHHGDGRLALWVKAPPGEQEALVGADPVRYFAPPYLGPRGWVAARVDDDAAPDWDEIVSLLDQAWRMTAGRRAVAAHESNARQSAAHGPADKG